MPQTFGYERGITGEVPIVISNATPSEGIGRPVKGTRRGCLGHFLSLKGVMQDRRGILVASGI
jgi:hypothetical protein